MGVSDKTAGADVAAVLVDIDAVGSGDIAWTMSTQASVETLCAWVIAETARISSSVALVKASGTVLMSDPLPLSRSPERPVPRLSARIVVLPISNSLSQV